jgi:hypothetical protein
MATIYLAARYGRRLELAAIARALTAAGHTITSRWLNGSHDGRADVEAALEDLQDIDAADTVVSFTEGPGAVPGRARGGRHVEFGYALARGHRCIVVGHRENVFHHVPGVLVVENTAQLLRALLLEEAAHG